MAFTINTQVLQTAINKAIKGAGNSKFSAITSLMNFVVDSGNFSITTTDSNNYFTVTDKILNGDPVTFTVNVDTFSKLIMKTSVENIKIDVTDSFISVTGNGTYKIPIQLDVDGTPIKYPVHEINNPEYSGTIKTSVIKTLILHNKPSLALTLEAPYLVNYLCLKNRVISADTFNICITQLPTFDKDVLIPPNVFELLSMTSEEDITYKIYQNNILFKTEKMKLFAVLPEGIEEYPVSTIDAILEREYGSDCILPKTALLNIIDRLSLFISDNDQNGLYMTFTQAGVKVESAHDDGIETVPYQGSNNFKDFTCFVGVESLKKQLNARVGETVHLYYGEPSTFRIEEDNVIQIISLLDDPRMES